MNDVTAQQVLKQLRWRYAVKGFDTSKRLSEESWSALEQSMILAPSSFGLQPWRFIVITDPAVKAQLPPISWGQPQPRDCSHMIVFTARRTMDEAYVDSFLESIVQTRGGELEKLKGLRTMVLSSISHFGDQLLVWNKLQVYLALGQLMTAAAMLGVDTCPMEGIDAAAYDKLLGLETSDYTTVVGCAVGYRDAQDKYASAKKVRFPSDKIVQRI